jgi:membrane carboxypeptidase/penicillin-binding protein
MITDMLEGVIDHGTARTARGAIKKTALAGKTGTSRDGWFVGYTPNLVCAVWIGFDDNTQLGLTGAEAALPAWVDFIKAAVDVRPDSGGRSFDQPEGISFVEVDPRPINSRPAVVLSMNGLRCLSVKLRFQNVTGTTCIQTPATMRPSTTR